MMKNKNLFYLLFIRVEFILAWNLVFLDNMSAKTTIRLWHELHESKHKAHDYADMLSPEKNKIHVGAINHDEIRAIGLCERKSLDQIYLCRIAHHPDHLNGPIHLLNMCKEKKIMLDLQKLRNQQRWYYEAVLLVCEQEITN